MLFKNICTCYKKGVFNLLYGIIWTNLYFKVLNEFSKLILAEHLVSEEKTCGSGNKLYISVSHTTNYVVPNSTIKI